MYLVLETYHERYYFSTEISNYLYESLDEICESYDIKREKLKDRKNGIWFIDETTRRKADRPEIALYTDIVEPKVTIIIDLAAVGLDDKFGDEIVWGKSNHKFGLLDEKGTN